MSERSVEKQALLAVIKALAAPSPRSSGSLRSHARPWFALGVEHHQRKMDRLALLKRLADDLTRDLPPVENRIFYAGHIAAAPVRFPPGFFL